MCSAKYGCFLYFIHAVIFRYVAELRIFGMILRRFQSPHLITGLTFLLNSTRAVLLLFSAIVVITILTPKIRVPVNKHVSLLKSLFIHYTVSLQQIHGLFQSEFSTENDLALPLEIFHYFLVSLKSSIANYVFFLVFPSLIYFLSNIF